MGEFNEKLHKVQSEGNMNVGKYSLLLQVLLFNGSKCFQTNSCSHTKLTRQYKNMNKCHRSGQAKDNLGFQKKFCYLNFDLVDHCFEEHMKDCYSQGPTGEAYKILTTMVARVRKALTIKMLDPSTQKLYKIKLNRTRIDKIFDDCQSIGKNSAERQHFVGFEGLDYWTTDNNNCYNDQIRSENKRIGECEQKEADITKKRKCFDQSTKLR